MQFNESETDDRERQQTLESWKEIAAYLQRDAKTARNWEKTEGLPVHRHTHKRIAAGTGIRGWTATCVR